jgi:hypothetical protein
VIGTAKPEDFLAVYDHKMLWRANLYIDERDGSEGGVRDDPFSRTRYADWNDAYPWVEGNEWNKTFDLDYLLGTVAGGNNTFTITGLQEGNGGQVIRPHDFTWNHKGGGDQDIADGRVAYDYNGQDSPFEFNFKMDNQRVLNMHGLTNGLYGYEQEDAVGDATIAPMIDDQRLHANYLKGAEYPHDEADMAQANYIVDAEPVTIDGNNYFPYVPSLSNSVGDPSTGDGIVGLPANPTYAGFAAGLDCVAFVMRSAGYPGNRYTLTQPGTPRHLGPALWGQSRGLTRYPYVGEFGVEVTRRNPFGDPVGLEFVRPGDVMYFTAEDDETRGAHAAIVVSVIDGGNPEVAGAPDGVIQMDEIWFIESTYSNFPFIRGVDRNDERTLASVEFRSWVIVRLEDR